MKQKDVSIVFIINIVVLGIFLARLLSYIFIGEPIVIKGMSMAPNYINNQHYFSNKLSYKFARPERGDVVIHVVKDNSFEQFAKRIIAIPGDTIKLENTQVYLNNALLDESSYLSSHVITSPGTFLSEGKTVTVPENSYIIMGDNRSRSFDSRNFGFVKEEWITAKLWFCMSQCN